MFNVLLPFVLNEWLLNGHEDILKGVLKKTDCFKNKYKVKVFVFKVIFVEYQCVRLGMFLAHFFVLRFEALNLP